MIAAGSMDRRIVIESDSQARNDFGEIETTSSVIATIWAKKTEKKASEYFEAGVEDSSRELAFNIRYRDDITPGMRVVYDGQSYDIEQVIEKGRRGALELVCVARRER